MNTLIIFLFSLILLIILLKIFKTEVKEPVKWGELYNDEQLNISILANINYKLNKIKVVEKIDLTDIRGGDVVNKNTYPEFKSVTFLNELKKLYEEDELILFFIEKELKSKNMKYKIDEYKALNNSIDLTDKNKYNLIYFLNLVKT